MLHLGFEELVPAERVIALVNLDRPYCLAINRELIKQRLGLDAGTRDFRQRYRTLVVLDNGRIRLSALATRTLSDRLRRSDNLSIAQDAAAWDQRHAAPGAPAELE